VLSVAFSPGGATLASFVVARLPRRPGRLQER
jgi:hypothetical protein